MLPRADSTFWGRFDFEPDGVHPSQAGETKAAGMLLEFFKNMPYTKCWFVANQYCL
jgi:lysophospholipase L1-like esterase